MKKSKGISNQMDMLNGSIFDKILLFALPLAISSILQQLFNSVDVAVVGRFASSEALAAVGSNSSVISLLINLFVGISVGANVVMANYIGQGKTEKIQDAVHTVMIVSLISGVFLLVLGLMIARPILEIMGTPENVIDLAVLYLHIYFLGMPFLMIYNFGAAVLRSKGDTKRPLYCLIISGVINAFDKVLVEGFDVGQLRELYKTLYTESERDAQYERWQSIRLIKEILLKWCEKLEDTIDVETLVSPLYILHDYRIYLDHLLSEEKQENTKMHIVETLGVQNFEEQEAIYFEEIERLDKLFQYLVLLSK